MIGSQASFRRRLLRWYDAHQRALPWRTTAGSGEPGTADPYRVLVSEAMLQQTTVAAVIPYFRRFMARFATAAELAAADEGEVLRLWQGLGYYARARNLLKAARIITGQLGGRMPTTVEGLRMLPGVGPYTAGAVGSIALGLRCAIVDANVERVLARVCLIEQDIRSAESRRRLWALAGELVPAGRPGDFNSALMDLGATVCTAGRPRCDVCPVRAHCQAAARGCAEHLPVITRKKASPLLLRRVVCLGRIARPGRWLLEQRPKSGRWAGMWQFPTIEDTGTPPRTLLGVRLSQISDMGELQHTLTHRRYRYLVCRAVAGAVKLKTVADGVERRWLTLEEIDRYPLPGPHAKILKLLEAI